MTCVLLGTRRLTAAPILLSELDTVVPLMLVTNLGPDLVSCSGASSRILLESGGTRARLPSVGEDAPLAISAVKERELERADEGRRRGGDCEGSES